jgi:hypothetical protein
MKILTIGSRDYQIHVVKYVRDALGQIYYQAGVIELAERCAVSGYKYSKHERTVAFWHEVVHGILEDMKSLAAYDERFVTKFSEILTAVIKQVHPHERNMVTQLLKGVRAVRKKVPRNKSAKKLSVRKKQGSRVRRPRAQSS